MIPLFGSKKRLCDGFSRRDLLHIGGLGCFGLTVDLFSRLSASGSQEATASRFGQAKSCILLFLFGSPAQHETFDPKPDAPVEIQGEMKPIATVVPELHIGERLPRTAQVVDRVTVVRSMTHQYPLHGVAYALTGMPTYNPAIEDLPRDPAHWPFIGSLVDYIESQRAGGRLSDIPRNMGLPWAAQNQLTASPAVDASFVPGNPGLKA